MATSGAAAYGVDVDSPYGVPLRWTLCSGSRNVGNSLARRFSTRRGALKSDPNYGLDLRSYLNAGISAARMAQLRSAIAGEAAKEEFVESVTSVTLTYIQARLSLRVDLIVQLAEGPFTFVFDVNQLSVDLLNQGRPTAGAGAAALVPTSNAPALQGPAGPPGIPGPAGPQGAQGPAGGGGGAGGITLPSNAEAGDNSGAEFLLPEFVFSLNAGAIAGGTFAVDAVMQAKVQSGTATIRLRLGGTYGGVDGTVIGSATVSSTGYVSIDITNPTVTNPTGIVPLKITIQSAGAGIDADILKPTITVT